MLNPIARPVRAGTASSGLNKFFQGSALAAPVGMLLPFLLKLCTFGQDGRSNSRNDDTRQGWPAELWIAIGIACGVFVLSAFVLQIALWYPESCLARCLIALRIPGVSTSVDERRSQRRNRASPVEGIPLTPLRQEPVASGPIAVGRVVPAEAVAASTAQAVAVPVT